MSHSAHDTVRAAAAGVSAHLIWQLSAKIASFSIKAVVVRALGPAQFAFVEIRIGILVTLALLPAIAGFRKVCLRIESEKHAAALAYLCVAVTLLLSIVLGVGAIYLDEENALTWMVITLSLLVRAFAEPPLVFARRRQRYEQSSRARAVSTVLSGVSQTVAVAMVTDKRFAAPASAMGHLFYSACLGVTMYIASGPQRVPMLTLNEMRKYLRRQDVVMTVVALGEGMIKFILENGEGIVLDVTCAAPIKGAYKLAGNVASMLARFFSEALEEQAFNVFHRLAPAFRSVGAKGEEKLSREREMRTTCISALIMALKAALLVSLLIAVVGPAYSYAFLKVLYGGQWADETPAPTILNMYFVYLVFMAANGVTEAFVTAAASTEELKARTKMTTVLSVIYMIALYFGALRYGAMGVIIVNCMNMAVRTYYSTWFYKRLTRTSVWVLKNALPHVAVLVGLLVARGIAMWSEQMVFEEEGIAIPVEGSLDFLGRVALHGVSGVIALGVFGGCLRLYERRFLSELRALRSHKD